MILFLEQNSVCVRDHEIEKRTKKCENGKSRGEDAG